MRQDSGDDKKARARSRSRPAARPPSRQDSWSVRDEREFPAKPKTSTNKKQPHRRRPRSPRPLPDPSAATSPPVQVKTHRTGGDGPPRSPFVPTTQDPGRCRIRMRTPKIRRLLLHPRSHIPPPQAQFNKSRTDRYLQQSCARAGARRSRHTHASSVPTAERDGEDRRRLAAQKQTKSRGLGIQELA